jgi:uncharacterized membrane protein YkoI
MKITLILIFVGLLMIPLRIASASYGLNTSLNAAKAVNTVAFNKGNSQDNKVKSRQQATQMVKKKYRAKVLNLKLTKVDGNATYEAKLLGRDGIVFYVIIDARSGQMRRR